MPDDVEPEAVAARLTAAHPQLFTTDMTRSCTFFTQQLGFSIGFLHGDPPFYGQVTRDGICLNLRHVDAMPFTGNIRETDHLLSAYVVVSDVEALYAECRARGAGLHQPLTTQPWDTRDFVVRDPDGNLILFASG
ncbi:bleomycin resistance protein [Phreatobacter stygius]|uniref:Bleomycin resistance protein n=1 Tax=Phreatobacter stygius TaxID=1940610 RepID=A0A4D7AVD5_9HYPH|nr:VOC family protein [Phreatobacter stygius]QCI63535.1 VOC family protein [Phreatobacter stygius]